MAEGLIAPTGLLIYIIVEHFKDPDQKPWSQSGS